MKPRRSSTGQERRSVREVLAVAALFLLMACIFVFVPDGLFRFALPKTAVLALALALALLACPRGRLVRQVAWAAAGVLVVFALSALIHDGLGPSFWGRWPRYEGVPTVGAYLLLLAVGARLLGPGAKPVIRTVWTRILAGSLLVLAILVVLHIVGLSIPESDGFRFGATLGNATDLGIVGLTGSAVLLPRAVFRKTPWDVLGAASGATAAVVSGSRAVLLVLTLLVVAVLAWRAREERSAQDRRVAPWWPLAGLALIAFAALALPGVRDRLLSGGTVTGRLDLWAATAALIGDNWALGVGPGQFVDALPRYQGEGFAARVGTDFPADSPHLIALQWLADGGVPLLLANVLLCSAVLWAGVRGIRKCSDFNERLFLVGALAATCSFALVLLTHFPSPGTTVIAGLSAGAVAAVVRSPAKANVGKPLRAAAVQAKPTPTAPAANFPAYAAASALVLLSGAAVAASLAENHLKVADTAVRDGRLAEASAQFENASSLRPWDADVALLAGQSFAGRAAAGDPESGKYAVDWSARSLQANSDSVESMTSLAVGQLSIGDISGAQTTLARARSAAPVNYQVWLQSGSAAYAGGHPDEAERFVERAAALTPDPAQALAVLAAIRQESGRP